MVIGFASEWIGENVGGVERYAMELLRGLLRIDQENGYEIFTTRRGPQALTGIETPNRSVRPTASNSRWYYVPIGLPLAVLKHPIDVLHATFAVVPWCPTKRIVLTIHDVGPDVHPEFFPVPVRWRFRWLVTQGIKCAAKVIVPTHATKQELLSHYHIADNKIVVIPEGVNVSFDSAECMSGETQESIGWLPASEFILYVGRFHARKNLVRLLQAFARLKQRSESPVKLVLPGMDMYHRRDVLSAIASLRLERDVVCPGRVSDRTLDMLYAKASVFAFPSLHEGFGLPPLEAMARGLPVMACNVSAMPEVLGDAAVLVDPYDVDAMADGLERLLWDSVLRRTLIERGKAWCKRYSWDTTARKTLSVYEDVFKGGD